MIDSSRASLRVVPSRHKTTLNSTLTNTMNQLDGGQRRGTVLICVLACLAVSGSLVALCIQSALINRRESKREISARQVEYLMDAGVARAKKSLIQDADYRGELWELPPRLLGGQAARIEISLEEVAAKPHDRTLRILVVARHGYDARGLGGFMADHTLIFDPAAIPNNTNADSEPEPRAVVAPQTTNLVFMPDTT